MTDTLDTDDTRSGGNTKTPSRARRVCFTLNNWKEEDLDTLTREFDMYIIGKECGEGGTPHLQGYAEFKNPRYFSSLKNINKRIHWEIAKGNRQQNIQYCSKEGNYISTFKERPLQIICQLKPWQKEIEDIVLSEPDDRTIHWFWETEGNVGKTALIKYLLHKYDFCTFTRSTKSADILTVADPSKTVYLFDFARCQEGFCPWMALEQLKDGLISDSKLKKQTRNIIMNSPHVICFANWSPDSSKLSRDRWRINYISSAGGGPADATPPLRGMIDATPLP